MKTFLQFQEEYALLSEALIQFNRNKNPNFGNIVILAGGAGSGKGFIKNNLLGIQGKSFDVDALKTAAMANAKIVASVKEQTGHDISAMDLRVPESVALLHKIVANTLKLDKKLETAFYSSVIAAAPDRKPNIIFDVTLKEIGKLDKIVADAQTLGYNKNNIHLVWALNAVDVAWKQNKTRARIVPEDIFMQTHEGASKTLATLLKDSKSVERYIGGDIFIAFNKVKVDSDLVTSSTGGKYIKRANYIHVKQAGKGFSLENTLSPEVMAKIASYVPNPQEWMK